MRCRLEIHTKMADHRVVQKVDALAAKYSDAKVSMDGTSVEYQHWHFNPRVSNAEPG